MLTSGEITSGGIVKMSTALHDGLDCRKCAQNDCSGYAVAGLGRCPDKNGDETDCNVCTIEYIAKCQKTCKNGNPKFIAWTSKIGIEKFKEKMTKKHK